MKRKLLLLTCTLLLLSGCGSDEDTTTSASSISEPQPTETAPAYDEEYYLELIPEVAVEIQGLRWYSEATSSKGAPDTFHFYMSNPEITNLTQTYLIAEGLLSDEWDATEEVVSVKYYISNDSIISGEPVSDEAVWLTPAIPLSTDLLYNLYDEVVIYTTDSSTSIELTPENFPSIELSDIGWADNYTYFGIITLTDADGNIYQSGVEPEDNSYLTASHGDVELSGRFYYIGYGHNTDSDECNWYCMFNNIVIPSID